MCAAIFELLMLFLFVCFSSNTKFLQSKQTKRIPVCIDLKESAAKVCGGSFRDFHIKCDFFNGKNVCVGSSTHTGWYNHAREAEEEKPLGYNALGRELAF